MQKKLIAMAVAGLVSGAAFAQSNVTIYGAADATYDNVKATGATSSAAGNWTGRGRTTMNSSFIGFKGAEDMGNGLKAVFQFETAIGENGGATNTMGASTYGWANRDTYAGIAGGFGVLVAGTLTGPARGLGAAMDINSGATGIGANTALIGKLGGGSGAGYIDQRFANTIAYISPSFSGLNAVVAYVPNENRSKDTGAGSATDTTGLTAGVNYNNGPIMAGYAWTQIKDKGSAGFGPVTTGVGGVVVDKVINNRAAAKYDFGMGTIGLMYDQTKGDVHAGPSVKQTVFYVPVTFNVGAGKIIAQYGQAGELKGVANGNNYKARHYEIGYEHSLSKRTILKALYSEIKNKEGATYDYLYGVSAPNTTAPGAGVSAGADPKGFSVGLRHSF